MLPLLQKTFLLTSFLTLVIFFRLPWILYLFQIAGCLFTFMCFSWLSAKWIHDFVSSKLLGPLSSEGKAILITGCDSGFGNGSALNLNKLGYRIFAGCLFPDGKGAQELKKSAKYPDKLHILKFNVTKDEDIDEAWNQVDQTLNQTGDILWGLCNNAGIAPTGKIEWGNFDRHFREVFEINVFAVVKITRKFLPLLRSSQGRVVTLSSINSRLTMLDTGAYSMTKHSLTAFQDALRVDVARFGIKVISIEPSFSRTPIIDRSAVLKAHQRMLDDSPKHVKDVYSVQDCEVFAKHLKVPEKYFQMEENYQNVVQKITKAFIDYEPPYRFACLPPIFQPLYSFCGAAPREWDFLFAEYMKKLSESIHDK